MPSRSTVMFRQTQNRLRDLFEGSDDPEVQDAWLHLDAYRAYPEAIGAFARVQKKLYWMAKEEAEGIYVHAIEEKTQGLARFIHYMRDMPEAAALLENNESRYLRILVELGDCLTLCATRAAFEEVDRANLLRCALAHPKGFERLVNDSGPEAVLAVAHEQPQGFERLLYHEEYHWWMRSFYKGRGPINQELWKGDPAYGERERIDNRDLGYQYCYTSESLEQLQEAQAFLGLPPASLMEMAALPAQLQWSLTFSRQPLMETLLNEDDYWGDPEDAVDQMMEEEQYRRLTKLTPLGEKIVRSIERIRENQRIQILDDLATELVPKKEYAQEREALKQTLRDQIPDKATALQAQHVAHLWLHRHANPTEQTREEIASLLRAATPSMLRKLSLDPDKHLQLMPALSYALQGMLPMPIHTKEWQKRAENLDQHLLDAFHYAPYYGPVVQQLSGRTLGGLIEFEPLRVQSLLIAQKNWQDRPERERGDVPPLASLCLELQNKNRASKQPITPREVLLLEEDLFDELLTYQADGKHGHQRTLLMQEALNQIAGMRGEAQWFANTKKAPPAPGHARHAHRPRTHGRDYPPL